MIVDMEMCMLYFCAYLLITLLYITCIALLFICREGLGYSTSQMSKQSAAPWRVMRGIAAAGEGDGQGGEGDGLSIQVSVGEEE